MSCDGDVYTSHGTKGCPTCTVPQGECASPGLDRKVVQVGPACRAGHGVIQDTTRGLELQPEPVCPLLDRRTIKAASPRFPVCQPACCFSLVDGVTRGFSCHTACRLVTVVRGRLLGQPYLKHQIVK